MQPKLYLFLLVMLVIALLSSGCAGSGQPEANNTTVLNAPESMYAWEFNQGYLHHANASGIFNNAVSLWDGDSYDAAAELLKEAGDEYATAATHYHDMAMYASNESERAFAGTMEDIARDMGEASSRYILSIDAARAGSNSSALGYFNDGKALIDRSMQTLNRTLGTVPSYI